MIIYKTVVHWESHVTCLNCVCLWGGAVRQTFLAPEFGAEIFVFTYKTVFYCTTAD